MGVRKRVRLPLSAAALFLSAGCVNAPPKVAPGFELKNLSGVAVGQSKAAVIEAAGEPLLTIKREDLPGRELLKYAEPGAVWIAGEYKTEVRGFECLVWIVPTGVEGARVFIAPSGPLCLCSEMKGCSPGWLEPCLKAQGTYVPGRAFPQSSRAAEERPITMK